MCTDIFMPFRDSEPSRPSRGAGDNRSRRGAGPGFPRSSGGAASCCHRDLQRGLRPGEDNPAATELPRAGPPRPAQVRFGLARLLLVAEDESRVMFVSTLPAPLPSLLKGQGATDSPAVWEAPSPCTNTCLQLLLLLI